MTILKTRTTAVILGLLVLTFGLMPRQGGAVGLRVRILATKANVRIQPNLQAPVITTVDKGQEFPVVEKKDDWYTITLASGQKGYLHRSVVEELADAAVPSAGAQAQKQPVAERPAAAAAAVKPPAATEREPVQSSSSEGPDRLGKKFYIRLGGGYASKTYSFSNSWSFDLYQEQGTVSEKYDLDASGAAFDAGIGFFFMRNLGLEISFVPASGKIAGTFASTFPHPFYFDTDREAAWEKKDLAYSSPELNGNLVVRFAAMPKLHVYLSAGGTYFLGVKVENLQTVDYAEVGYPYADISVTPQYKTYTKSGFGFNGGGGLDYFLGGNFAINANVRYVMGEVKLDIEGSEVTIKPGGLKASLGIKLLF